MGSPNQDWLGGADLDRPDFMERHYTLRELAKAWHLSYPRVQTLFEREPGVVVWGENRIRKGAKRAYVSRRVPESVARRVYKRIMRNVQEATGRV